MKNILVTGATGFIGRNLCVRLQADGWRVLGTILADQSPTSLVNSVIPFTIEPFGLETSCKLSFKGIDTVIHLAARVHVMRETAADPLKEYRAINTESTSLLARRAAADGVKRFIFMSTIGVNGNNSGNKPYTEDRIPQPHNPYSRSKHEAEFMLQQISAETGIEVVTIRSPLAYGPGNPGNFLALLNTISKGFPLPLASIQNKRSLIYVGNLVDALATCAKQPSTVGKTYLVSDGEDISTPELIMRVAQAMGKPVRLFPVPPALLRLTGTLLGKKTMMNRLMESLTVDSSLIRTELGWQPPFTMEQGLKVTVDWFKENVVIAKKCEAPYGVLVHKKI